MYLYQRPANGNEGQYTHAYRQDFTARKGKPANSSSVPALSPIGFCSSVHSKAVLTLTLTLTKSAVWLQVPAQRVRFALPAQVFPHRAIRPHVVQSGCVPEYPPLGRPY